MGQLLLGPREEPEQVQTRRVPDAAAVATAITELAERLHDDERERENIMPLLQRLPESLQALPEIARQQAKLGEAIATSLVQSRQRDQSIESILERIAQGVGQQTDTFGLVQQQLDLNHQASQRIAEAVATLAQGVGDLSSGQRRNSDSLVGLLDRMRDRDETIGKIQGRLHEDERERENIMPLLQRLPESLQALPEIARQQAKLGEAIATSLVQSRQRDQSIESILERIAQGVGQQTDTFGLVQQQLDLNHQAAQRIAEAVATLAQGVGDLSSGQRRNSDSLVGLLDRMRDRDESIGKIQGRLHLWLVFSTAVACGSMIACLLLAWAAIRALTST